MCNNCIHKAVCSIYTATGGVKRCEHFKEERKGKWARNEPNPEAMREWHRQGIGKAMSEGSIFWTCSLCDAWGTPRENFCPNCGADMRGAEDGK